MRRCFRNSKFGRVETKVTRLIALLGIGAEAWVFLLLDLDLASDTGKMLQAGDHAMGTPFMRGP
jgi:hypothetical protein